MRTLVIYYSRTGNTKFVATKIAKCLDADLCEVIDKKNRNGRFVYLTGGFAGFRKKLTKIEVPKPIDNYDFIIIGSPVWAGNITPAIRTFLENNDFSKKELAFFVTIGGNKPQKALKNMKEAVAPKIPIGELAIINDAKDREEAKQMIENWCNNIKPN